nr:glutamate-gated chloride channel subunit beta-like [Penaeus vannamei]
MTQKLPCGFPSLYADKLFYSPFFSINHPRLFCTPSQFFLIRTVRNTVYHIIFIGVRTREDVEASSSDLIRLGHVPQMLNVSLQMAFSVGAEAPEGQATQIVLEKLRDKENYNSAVRPSPHGDPTEVKVQMYIREIDVDDANMKADFDLTFRMVWNDPRLTYDGAGVSYVNILTPHLAWLPDAFFKYAITTQLESVYPESYLRVYPNGRLIYSTRLSLKQNCPMNFARFPHDTQDYPLIHPKD